MYETNEYTEKKKEKEAKRREFSLNYFGVLLTLGLNVLFYVIAMIGAYALEAPHLMIATWPIAGVLLLEVIAVGLAAIFEIVKARSYENLFKANIFKSIARLTGFLVGVGCLIYGIIAGREFDPSNAIAVLESFYGGVMIVFSFPMFIWSILHLSTVSAFSGGKPYKEKKKDDDDVVVDTTSSSPKETQAKSNSTDDAIEVEVHDINEA